MKIDNWVEVAIGLGSNLDNPQQQVLSAAEMLANSPQISDFVCSKLLISKPQGPQDQPDFVNACARFKTNLAPLDLLAFLQNIEQQHHRVKLRKWGERTLDLDILLYGDQQISLPNLQIPHLEMHNRDFVLLPLFEIWPTAEIPGKPSLQQLINQLNQRFIKD